MVVAVEVVRKKLEMIKEMKALLTREEAKLVRLLKQGKPVAQKLAIVRRERFGAISEELRLLRILRQSFASC